ncbi:DEAD/DEAH box helicase [Vibrio parahaemolyticus]|uniref:DEAD/DEAH box helicase n=1 Tax=Vibrio parahaemolyticus TaxID=670 RepID=UPI0011216A15|nr:DEAD/DEAH box helicase [Vibrio parahaemolyticus]TOF39292.1 DEAD/DEAH box helicase [Vibrio parahaemolyticus]TOF48425.1 DEAD/DEAH box helicase [Vibrio parahaemolyticus]
MDTVKAQKLFDKLENDEFAQNLIAQSNAKNILLAVKEDENNFPNFTEGLTDRINSIAFAYLSIGCAMAEENEINDIALRAFEKAGDIIYYIHSPNAELNNKSRFYLVVSSLSFYLASQYSKSFIAIKDVKAETPLINLFSCFLRKDLKALIHEINRIQLSDEDYEFFEDELERNNKNYEIILSKSLNLVLEYILSGNEECLYLGRESLTDLKELASIDDEPVIWWLSRLLIILLDVFKRYSFWGVIPKLIKSDIISDYIEQLALRTPPITELFFAQYNALRAMQDSNDIVLSLPTSSGKTRIAEIAILEALADNPLSKVLYLAPFRSLSYEVEESMEKTLAPLGFSTTFLYGGGQFSKLDKALVEKSNVIIATPEKAKAIIRADEDIANGISLLIIDEGHLLGAEERLIKIELFIEELKHHVNKNGGKIMLLSAVLPNTNDIAQWIAKDSSSVYQTDKTVANKRFGIIKWTQAKNVTIEWFGEPISYNKNFVEKFLPPRARTKYFPNDKNEGIAATALKLSKLGTVLMFIAQARYVVSSANRVLKAMGGSPALHNYNNKVLFESFRLACDEAGVSDIYELARYGILCHFGKLPIDVRILTEQLMRTESVKVIVSTTSLGQGVNIGISTVIFSDVFMNHQNEIKIDSKDFWNIAGRAGRAFTDIEGKVLYCVDETNWSYQRDIGFCHQYFDSSKMEHAKSGLLALVQYLKNISIRCNVSFELLLDLVANNDFSQFKTESQDYSDIFSQVFDWVDDTLLALDYKNKAHELQDPSSWIDEVFRNSLAYIQALDDEMVSQDDIINFLKSRNRAVIKMAGDYVNWEGMVKSGIPLSSSKEIENYIEPIIESIKVYKESEGSVTDLAEFSKGIEKLIQQLPTVTFKHGYEEAELDEVRLKWFSAQPLSEISIYENGQDICVSYFSMTLPWAINAIIRKLFDLELDDEAKTLEELALYCEIGVPNIESVKIYLSGLKSRVASFDLSNALEGNLTNLNKPKLVKLLKDNLENIEFLCGKTTNKWVELFTKEQENIEESELAKIGNFVLKNTEPKGYHLNVRSINDRLYLCNEDFSEKILITSTKKFPLRSVADNPKVYFEKEDSHWAMRVRGSRN